MPSFSTLLLRAGQCYLHYVLSHYCSSADWDCIAVTRVSDVETHNVPLQHTQLLAMRTFAGFTERCRMCDRIIPALKVVSISWKWVLRSGAGRPVPTLILHECANMAFEESC